MDIKNGIYLSINRSLFGCLVLLNIEVFDLVSLLVLGNHIQEFSKAVLFQIFLCEVLKISLGEGNGAVDIDFCSIVGDFDLISQFSGFAIDFNSLTKILSKVRGDENLIFDGLGAVDSKAEGLVFFLFFCDGLGLLHWSGGRK